MEKYAVESMTTKIGIVSDNPLQIILVIGSKVDFFDRSAWTRLKGNGTWFESSRIEQNIYVLGLCINSSNEVVKYFHKKKTISDKIQNLIES